MVFCSSCGSKLLDGDVFCADCGARVPTPSASASSPASNKPPSTYAASYPPPSSSSPSNSGGSTHAASNAYLPGKMVHEGNLDKSLASAFGIKSTGGDNPQLVFTGGSVGVCQGCGKAIQGPNISALDAIWHNECFKCAGCGEVFFKTGNHKFLEKNGQPYCENCYGNKFGEICGACGKRITVGAVLRTMGSAFHGDCFRCSKCNKVLAGGRTLTKGGKPYCRDCVV